MLKLKKQMHKDIAKAQDFIMEEAYKVFSNAVLHGGTSIWRCYHGNRFSEDIDLYIPRDNQKINLLFENLSKKGFTIEKKKIGERSLYSTLRWNTTRIRCEALFKKVKSSLHEYEKVDGNFLTVYTLTPEELITEKVPTYLKRLKVRDLYDIFFLLRYTQNIGQISSYLQELLRKFKKPLDEKDLRILLLEGLTPSVEDMLGYIKQRISHG